MNDQLDIISQWLTSYYANQHYEVSLTSDFLQLAMMGMRGLKDAGLSNVIYGLAKGQIPNEDDSVFPTKRMPMGLLHYMINFFISKPGEHVSALVLKYMCNCCMCVCV